MRVCVFGIFNGFGQVVSVSGEGHIEIESGARGVGSRIDQSALHGVDCAVGFFFLAVAQSLEAIDGTAHVITAVKARGSEHLIEPVGVVAQNAAGRCGGNFWDVKIGFYAFKIRLPGGLDQVQTVFDIDA